MLIKYERGFVSQMKYLFSTHYITVQRRQDSILWTQATIQADSLKQRTMTTYVTLIAFIYKCGWYQHVFSKKLSTAHPKSSDQETAFLGIYEMKTRVHTKHLHMDPHNSFICNSNEQQTTQMCFQRTNGSTVMHPYHRPVLGSKMELLIYTTARRHRRAIMRSLKS